VIAANLTIAQELRQLPADPEAESGSKEAGQHWDRETDVNFGLGVSYRFMSNWSAGFEFLNEREFSSFSLSAPNRTNVAYFLGPTLHYGGKNFFVTLTWLGQLKGARDYANPPPGFIVDGRTNADDFEMHRIRLKVDFYF
jgi:uncharacterized protein DUF6662